MGKSRDTTSLRAIYGKREERYLELIQQFPLRPLRTDADLDAAVGMLDLLLDQDELEPPEQDYLDLLRDLVEAYENEMVPINPVRDADMLRFLMEVKGVASAQVAKETGIAESALSEGLAGKRQLNRTQIARLARYFHVAPGTFAVAE